MSQPTLLNPRRALRSSRRPGPWLALLAAGAVGPALAPKADTAAATPRLQPQEAAGRQPKHGGGEVHGYVIADLGRRRRLTTGAATIQRGRLHFLPGITAYLKNQATASESPRVTTDLKGFFMVPRQPAGRYQLCLEGPGYNAACPQLLTITNEMVFLPPAAIEPKRGVLSGVVLLANGAPCNFSDPSFGVQFDTRVSVVDAGGKLMAEPVRANFAGQYLVPAVPPGAVEVRATCEAASATRSVSLAPGAAVANLSLVNRPPSMAAVVARQGGRAVRRAAPGATVEVRVDARDSDALHYTWAVSGSAATFAPGDSPSVQWTLPASPGRHSIYVVVRDGRGGVSLGRRDISTDSSSLLFTGIVQDRERRAVEAAGVVLVGLKAGEASGRTVGEARSNAAGHFAILAPEESERYVLTIRKPGYQVLSQVLTEPAVGRRYQLMPAQKLSFDAQQGGRLLERGDRTCSLEANATLAASNAKLPLKRRIALWRKQPRCGAQLVIPPGALVDGKGSPASGSVTAFISSIDLRDPAGRFPGEYAGLTRTRREVALNSVGAVDVTVTDGAGQALALAPGQKAVVRIPIDPLQLGMPGMPATLPATIPIWFYDPQSGLWNEEGVGNLRGDYYEAEVRHFSTINADLEFSTPACMRVHTDITRLRIPYQVRVSVPASAPVKVKTATIDDALSVVVRLPENTDVKFEPLDSAGQAIPLAAKVQSTLGTSSPAFPAYDYASCTSDVTLTFGEPTSGGALDYFGQYVNAAAEADDYYAKIDPVATAGAGTVSSAGTVVTGAGAANFTGFIEAGHILRAAGQVRTVALVTNATTLETETAFSPPLPGGTAYEKVGVKQTLDAWKTANGFGADDQDAVYLNKPDLGLGRWMHKKKVGSNIAYYVSNYGVPPNFGSADLAAFAKLTNNPAAGLIATVAMEYSPHPTILPADRYTKFYVFNAAGARVNKADLDGNGAKYVPKLCMACHGGEPGTVVGDSRGNGLARFIAFDPDSFGYSGFDDPLNPGTFPFSQAAQQPAFKEMNRGVRDDTNVSTALLELIEGWYGGALLPAATQNANYVHKGWRLTGTGTPAGTSPVDKAQLYRDVVRPSCRSCHNTRDNTVSWDKWDGPALFDGFREDGATIKSYVCGPTRIMPHAKVTYANFWLSTSPHQPATLGNGGVDTWAPSYPCPCRDSGDLSPENAALPACP
jgi:hypothetical protein